MASGKNAADDVSVNVGKAHVSATKTVCQFLVVQSEQPQDRGVEIEHFGDVLHRTHAHIIGRAIDQSAFQATTCHPDCEGGLMVIATVRFGAVRCAAELGGPNHECLLEQASGL